MLFAGADGTPEPLTPDELAVLTAVPEVTDTDAAPEVLALAAPDAETGPPAAPAEPDAPAEAEAAALALSQVSGYAGS